jgi:hypothetical protein
MKYKKRTLRIVAILLLILAAHGITYTLDKNAIEKGKAPRFAFAYLRVKDGGSNAYCGIGYQILRWHRFDPPEYPKREVGYEIYRFPSFKKWEEGPKSTTRFFDYHP